MCDLNFNANDHKVDVLTNIYCIWVQIKVEITRKGLRFRCYNKDLELKHLETHVKRFFICQPHDIFSF
jgi:hypothetical protein